MIGGKTFVYNTSTVYNNKGELIAKHRKVCDKSLCRWGFQGSFVRHQRSWRPEVLWEWHSDSGQPSHDIQLSMGKNWIRNLLWYPIPWVEVWSSYVWGRLWGSSMLMTKEGCRMLIFPSAFNTTTGMHLRKKSLFSCFILSFLSIGPLHWQLLARSRAVDNQLFVTMISPARNMKSNYVCLLHCHFDDF